MTATLDGLLTALHLHQAAVALPSWLERAAQEELGYADFLAGVLEEELDGCLPRCVQLAAPSFTIRKAGGISGEREAPPRGGQTGRRPVGFRCSLVEVLPVVGRGEGAKPDGSSCRWRRASEVLDSALPQTAPSSNRAARYRRPPTIGPCRARWPA